MTQKMIVEFEDGQEPKAVMQAVLKAYKKDGARLVRSQLVRTGAAAPEPDGQGGAFSFSYDSTIYLMGYF